MQENNSLSINCEFCIELKNFKSSRYAKLYGEDLGKRFICENKQFIVAPTIGQIFFGHSLILTKKHYFSVARIPLTSYSALISIINRMESILNSLGKVVLFEHGTSPKIGSGCGIYHAHLHIVPLPENLPPEYLFNNDFIHEKSLLKIMDLAKKEKEYLLYRDTNHQYYISFPMKKTRSQFFRRKLVDYFGLLNSWDWKSYNFEKNMKDFIRISRASNL